MNTTTHPTFQRLRAIAARQGSQSTTPRGLLKWFRAHALTAAESPRWQPRQFSTVERDVRRARADARYRRRLTTELRRLQRPVVVGSITAWLGYHAGIVQRANHLGVALSAPPQLPVRPVNAVLLGVDPELYRAFGGRLPNGAKRVWSPSWRDTSLRDVSGEWRFADTDRPGYYSRSQKQYWSPGEHSIAVASHAFCHPAHPAPATSLTTPNGAPSSCGPTPACAGTLTPTGCA